MIKEYQLLIVSILFLLLLHNSAYSNWSLTGNLNGGDVSSLISTEQYLFAGTSTNGIFRSGDNGLTWIQVNSGLGNSLNIQALSVYNTFVYAGTLGSGFFYSSDYGENWIQANQGLGQLNVRALTSDSSGVYAGCILAGVFRTTNNGLNWTRFALGEGDLLYSISIKSHFFYIGLEGGILRTTNYGLNWSFISGGLTNNTVRSVVQSESDAFCGTFGGGVFYFNPSILQWQPMNSGLPGLEVRKLFIFRENLFAGIENKGIYFFDRPSDNWVNINQGLADTNISSMTFKDNYIYIGSKSGNIWKRPIQEIITDIKQNVMNIEDYRLYQNYPNPFNPTTNISFYIPERNFVTLKVYDNTGREVSEIFKGILTEGIHNKYWSGENFSSGIFYYTLQAGQFSQTKKFVLIK